MERVELAAYCADKAAWLAAGAPWFGSQGERRGSNMGSTWAECRNILAPAGLATWVQGLSRWGPDALVRAASAAARETLPLAPPSAKMALLMIDAWLECPCDTHAMACRGACAALDPDEMGLGVGHPESPFVHALAAVFWRHPGEDVRRGHRTAAEKERPDSHAMHAMTQAVGLAGEQPVREAIQSALVSWALGEQP